MAAGRTRIVWVLRPFAGSGIPRSRSGSMSWFNSLLWSRPRAIWSCGIPVLSVAEELIISQLPVLSLETAPAPLFLCAVMLGAWWDGVGPEMLGTALACLAFNCYFLEFPYSF